MYERFEYYGVPDLEREMNLEEGRNWKRDVLDALKDGPSALNALTSHHLSAARELEKEGKIEKAGVSRRHGRMLYRLTKRGKKESLDFDWQAAIDEATGSGKLGKPEIIDRMKYGGTRYKFRHGIGIDHVEKEGKFHVWQAHMRGTNKLGLANSLEAAKKLALQKADIKESLDEARSKSLGKGKYEYKGKKGVWRTLKSGDKVFFPDDKTGPMAMQGPKGKKKPGILKRIGGAIKKAAGAVKRAFTREELEAELARLESTSSPFPEVRARRIEEVKAELYALREGLMTWASAEHTADRWGGKVDKTYKKKSAAAQDTRWTFKSKQGYQGFVNVLRKNHMNLKVDPETSSVVVWF